ncbi:hypothetical protein LTR84_005814 [Exophiala bonariae]|uniref:Carotenoid oxygenase n=1 Tax=Exophiala bonariae TaxID=1690606 RepID=A0AAV9N3F4_9EURO|nr:hypothetical protein LTR84_005814 [Exophiala bonariae]
MENPKPWEAAVNAASPVDTNFGLRSPWDKSVNPAVMHTPIRWQGFIKDLEIVGELPKQIKGTFYRVAADPFYPMHPDNWLPIEGDGNVTAFRFADGQVDMKVRYVETERLKLERQAGKRLFGLYRNPYSHHPCVQAAVDSTANTNLVLWAGKLIALKEGNLPYELDPNTLATRGYDPFKAPDNSKTFTAHPKVDPFTNELVVFGFEAKGLATTDAVIYTLDKNGVTKDVSWVKCDWQTMIHDCVVTENFIILLCMPFEANLQRMKEGKHHWRWLPEHKSAFLVAPRRPGKNLPPGWKIGEWRTYYWGNCITIHSAGGWEENGKIYLETSRMRGMNLFAAFNGPEVPPFDPTKPPNFTSDLPLWEIDLSLPDGATLPDPSITVGHPAEFMRIDERFLTQKYQYVFGIAIYPLVPPGPLGFNCFFKHDRKTGKNEYYYPGDQCSVEEPIFIPRSKDAPEGDGFIVGMVEHQEAGYSELVVLDSNNFSQPVALVKAPFRLMNQIHGNWCDIDAIPGDGGSSLAPEFEFSNVKVSGQGLLPLS